MRRFFSVLIFLVILSQICYGSEIRNLLQESSSKTHLSSLIIADKTWVPYPSYADRNGWDSLTEGYRDDFIKDGERQLNFKWEVIKATDFLEFERTGSRVMQTPFERNVQALGSLVFAELSEGEGRFLDQIINGVWFFTEMSTWATSAHLPRFQSTNRALPAGGAHVIDLSAGDMGSFLSWIHYFFKDSFDKIDPVIAQRLEATLYERILNTYMERSDFSWQAFNLKPGDIVNNWNPWCNFNVLTSFLLLENNPEKLAAGVYRTMVSVDQFINYYSNDGACEEGPSYWQHAAGKLYDYLKLLSFATRNRVNIFGDPLIKNIGEYISKSYVGDGWMVNFADASAKGGGDIGLIYQYGQAVNSVEMQQFAAYLYEGNNRRYTFRIGRDLFRVFEGLQALPALKRVRPALPKAASIWYPGTEFGYIRNGGDIFLAVKGGNNNESHNHNDIGTFSLYWDKTPFFIDVGVGSYTRETFSRERYSIWTMQSGYHNLPSINGFDQRFGKQYVSNNVEFKENKNEFSLDISKAYPSEAKIKTWNRSIKITKDQTVVIKDDYELEESLRGNQINYMLWAKPDISKSGEVLLKKDGKTLKLYYPADQLSAKVETIALVDSRLSRVWGKEIYRLKLVDLDLKQKGSYQFKIKKM